MNNDSLNNIVVLLSQQLEDLHVELWALRISQLPGPEF